MRWEYLLYRKEKIVKFYNYLQEARRNPELNPKINIVEALKPYKDKQDCFIQFSNVNKLGINPKSKFNTPIGVYSYPLVQMWEDIRYNNIPYAGKRDFVILFSCSHPMIIEVDEYNDYMLEKDVKFYEREIFEKYGNKIFHTEYSSLQELTNDFKNNSFENARFNHPFMKFWNYTRKLSELLYKEKIGKFTGRPSVTWNTLLRMRDYVGFTDRKGMGFIHPNEATQAMFLSKKYLKIIDIFPNKRYERLSKEIVINKFDKIMEIIKNEKLSNVYFDDIVVGLLTQNSYTLTDFNRNIQKIFTRGNKFDPMLSFRFYLRDTSKSIKYNSDLLDFLMEPFKTIIENANFKIPFDEISIFFDDLIKKNELFKSAIEITVDSLKEELILNFGNSNYLELYKKYVGESS